jgi:hypothetical protein
MEMMMEKFDDIQCEDFWGEELMFKPDFDTMEAEEEALAAAKVEPEETIETYDVHEYLRFVYSCNIFDVE